MTVRYICGDYGDGHVVEGGVDLFQVYDLTPTSVAGQLNPQSAQLLVSPNPLQESAVVSWDFGTEARLENAVFEVHDLFGRLLYQRVLNQNRGSFLLDKVLARGVYIGSLQANGQVVKTFRMVK
jgi:hypothetical protein